MSLQTVTLDVPETIYEQLQVRATQSQRSVQDEMLHVIATAIPGAESLPAELANAVSQLAVLDDAALWQAARVRLALEAAEQLASLHQKQQSESLTAEETDQLTSLVHQYERTMLVRAEAASILKQRGHDVASLNEFECPTLYC